MEREEWKRTLWLMVGVQAVMSGSYQVASPFLPLFLIQIGVHPLTQVMYWSGIIISSNSLLAAMASPFWGHLSDRVGRKAMVLRSAVAVGIAMALMGFCNNVWELLGTRVLMGFFSGFSASAMALVATQAPGRSLGYALGWLSTGQIVGTLAGPLIGGLLADQIHDYRTVFFVSAGGITIMAIVLTLFVHETFVPAKREDEASGPFLRRFAELARNPDLAPMFLVIMLAQVCAVGLTPIVPLYVRSMVGDVPWLATASGAALAVTGVAGLLGSPFLGRRSDVLGYRPVLLTSLAGAAIFTIPQALAINLWMFLGLRFGVGIFLGGILPTANALVGRLARRHERGQIYGLTSTAQFFGRFCGPLLGGVVAAHFGLSAVFIVIGSLMLANLAWVAANVRGSGVS